jgi:hypothetical protein
VVRRRHEVDHHRDHVIAGGGVIEAAQELDQRGRGLLELAGQDRGVGRRRRGAGGAGRRRGGRKLEPRGVGVAGRQRDAPRRRVVDRAGDAEERRRDRRAGRAELFDRVAAPAVIDRQRARLDLDPPGGGLLVADLERDGLVGRRGGQGRGRDRDRDLGGPGPGGRRLGRARDRRQDADAQDRALVAPRCHALLALEQDHRSGRLVDGLGRHRRGGGRRRLAAAEMLEEHRRRLVVEQAVVDDRVGGAGVVDDRQVVAILDRRRGRGGAVLDHQDRRRRGGPRAVELDHRGLELGVVAQVDLDRDRGGVDPAIADDALDLTRARGQLGWIRRGRADALRPGGLGADDDGGGGERLEGRDHRGPDRERIGRHLAVGVGRGGERGVGLGEAGRAGRQRSLGREGPVVVGLVADQLDGRARQLVDHLGRRGGRRAGGGARGGRPHQDLGAGARGDRRRRRDRDQDAVAGGVDPGGVALGPGRGRHRRRRGGRGGRGGRRGRGRLHQALGELGHVVVVVGQTPGELHLGRDRAHDVLAGEEADLVDRVAIARVRHRHRQVAVAVQAHRHDPMFDRHVARQDRDHRRRHLGQGGRADLGHHQPAAVELGQGLVAHRAGRHQVLAQRAAGLSLAPTRRRQGVIWDQPRADEEGTGVISHDGICGRLGRSSAPRRPTARSCRLVSGAVNEGP